MEDQQVFAVTGAYPGAEGHTTTHPLIEAAIERERERRVTNVERRAGRPLTDAERAELAELVFTPDAWRPPPGSRHRFAHVVKRTLPRPAPVAQRTAPRSRGAGRPRAQASRSCAESGDSGEGGEPPAEPWRWASPTAWSEMARRRRGAVA